MMMCMYLTICGSSIMYTFTLFLLNINIFFQSKDCYTSLFILTIYNFKNPVGSLMACSWLYYPQLQHFELEDFTFGNRFGRTQRWSDIKGSHKIIRFKLKSIK
ncbi:Hypothetical_protein [Hexamita inflata]|uniref:Hypothetical_protein n=1 Tax=Hexamita inflata TaxID=28002 RepID=A0AA86TZX7_9EUKA|nr:Hypothetical protein HINF_LOCUS24075 [Hexamita inflata]